MNVLNPQKETQPPSSRKWGWNKNTSLLFRCATCQKEEKLEKVIRQQIPVKDEAGRVLYGCFNYVYFCSSACQMLGEKAYN